MTTPTNTQDIPIYWTDSIFITPTDATLIFDVQQVGNHGSTSVVRFGMSNELAKDIMEKLLTHFSKKGRK